MEAALSDALDRFNKRNPKSRAIFEKAQASLPGGNTRSAIFTAPFPISMRRGVGYKLFDEDGHEFVDLVGELTAGIFGHTDARLTDTIVSTFRDIGFHLGATTAHEEKYASYLCHRFGIDNIRFTNSGTEANLHCLAAARRFTGRRRVVAFRGGYHGGVLSFGSGVAENNVDRDDWIVVQYNDLKELSSAFNQHGKDIAAVIMEGMQGASGAISATPEFLDEVREVTRRAGALFILDEVISSRLAPGGLKSLLTVEPDLVTYGKYLGGGMPFGAFGGRGDIMRVYDPRAGPAALGHSGTFQNNVAMLRAGLVGMSQIYSPDVVVPFNERGRALRERLAAVMQGTRMCVTGRGTLMCIHSSKAELRAESVTCKDDIVAVEDPDLKRLFWLEMLERGFWVLLRGSIALNLQITDEAIQAFVEEVQNFINRHESLVRV